MHSLYRFLIAVFIFSRWNLLGRPSGLATERRPSLTTLRQDKSLAAEDIRNECWYFGIFGILQPDCCPPIPEGIVRSKMPLRWGAALQMLPTAGKPIPEKCAGTLGRANRMSHRCFRFVSKMVVIPSVISGVFIWTYEDVSNISALCEQCRRLRMDVRCTPSVISLKTL